MTTETKSSADILKDLIGFNTISDQSNLPLMQYIQDYLLSYGVSSTLIKDTNGQKANLHAVIGPRDVSGIVLSGHTDVVPVAGQDWNTDPFEMVEKDEAYYGRGTCDMKGFVAVVLSKVPEMVQADLKKPFHLAFSYDEEVGCQGVSSLIDLFKTMDEPSPEFCIVGEPTMMAPITAHKGGRYVYCDVTGHECHSSRAPYGVNALEYAAELIAQIKKITRRIAEEGPFDPGFDPPFSTLNVGMFDGGTALNIVPNKASFKFAIRSIPNHPVQDIVDEIKDYAFKMLEPHMRAIDPTTGFAFSEPVQIPALMMDDAAIIQTVLNLTGENSTKKVSFATEAGHFQNAGIPTIVCGPGDIAQAHRPNEFIAKAQLSKCGRFLDKLIDHASSS